MPSSLQQKQMGRKKQDHVSATHHGSQAASSAAHSKSAASTRAPSQTDKLADALADISLHSQSSPPASASVSSSQGLKGSHHRAGPSTDSSTTAASQAPAPLTPPPHTDTLAHPQPTPTLPQQPNPTAPPPAPRTASSSEPTSSPSQHAMPHPQPQVLSHSHTSTDSTETQGSLIDQVMRLRDTVGTGLLAAMIMTFPHLRALEAGGQRSEATGWVVRELIEASRKVGETQGIETQLQLLQGALKEAITTLPLEHESVLALNLEFAQQLYVAQKYEQSYAKWRWLIPRSARLPEGCQHIALPQLFGAKCLKELGRYADAVPLAHEAYKIRSAKYGAEHGMSMQALELTVMCDAWASCLPAETLSPLLEKYIACLRRSDREYGDDNTPTMLACLEQLQNCQLQLEENAAAEATAREWVRLAKKHLGTDHHTCYKAIGAQGIALSKLGQHARAIPLLRRVLDRGVTAQGIGCETTIQSALALAAAYGNAGEWSTSVEVFAKAWSYAKTAMGPNDPLNRSLCNLYMLALVRSGDEKGARAVAEEALRRGMEPPTDINY